MAYYFYYLVFLAVYVVIIHKKVTYAHFCQFSEYFNKSTGKPLAHALSRDTHKFCTSPFPPDTKMVSPFMTNTAKVGIRQAQGCRGIVVVVTGGAGDIAALGGKGDGGVLYRDVHRVFACG
jgi:hypothetical protein